MKLLSVAVPCYNSQDYMEHCIATLLSGGADVEIIIVDDGSTDGTAAIADRLAAERPEIIRAVHQENKGHGGAVTTGLREAAGLYFKVVDSDDWVDEDALRRVLSVLREFAGMERPPDLLVSNYIYDKAGAARKKAIRYGNALPPDRVLTWDDVGRFRKGQYLLMHALIYRTECLRTSALVLPEHTFYVDNLYAYTPLANVETLYYLDADLYHYFIGREGQSVQEQVMIRRIDQQLRVNRMMLEQVSLETVANRRQRDTMFNYLDIITVVSNMMLILADTPEHTAKKDALWGYIRTEHPYEYRRLRRGLFGRLAHLRGRAGRRIDIGCYRISNKIFGFN